MLKPCVCCSGRPFVQCCEPLLNNQNMAKTPVALMRSRYSAYALGNFGEYLLSTWSIVGAMGMTAAELSIRNQHWQGLEIISESQQGDHGKVEFKAVFLDAKNSLNVHHEYSKFERISGRWFYISGEVFA